MKKLLILDMLAFLFLSACSYCAKERAIIKSIVTVGEKEGKYIVTLHSDGGPDFYFFTDSLYSINDTIYFVPKSKIK